MDIEAFRAYCLTKNGVTEDFPFDEVTLVFKVMGKIFAITGLDAEDFSVNLKALPENCLEYRDRYESVIPGYHMNKKHWNTVFFDTGEIPESTLKQWIDDSYDLVVQGLTKKLRDELQSL
jgi:predicted DNA-binding protein (MmcQ/YjbR family)